MPSECPSCGSPEPRLHPALAPDGEVTRICDDKFHDQEPTLRISKHLGLYLHIPKKARLTDDE
jgi:hypothetical protein